MQSIYFNFGCFFLVEIHEKNSATQVCGWKRDCSISFSGNCGLFFCYSIITQQLRFLNSNCNVLRWHLALSSVNLVGCSCTWRLLPTHGSGTLHVVRWKMLDGVHMQNFSTLSCFDTKLGCVVLQYQGFTFAGIPTLLAFSWRRWSHQAQSSEWKSYTIWVLS